MHVQARGENGLTRNELGVAYRSGMRRISCGLETGSQRVNDSMAKGTRLEPTSRFIRDAHGVGLSVRATMMLGYPGETSEDVAATCAGITPAQSATFRHAPPSPRAYGGSARRS